ncbi:MAG TPA: SDR family oxidoreductase [Anaerolineae bacterium]|nr:SDR family oxidoreductase [Anaerolineae bacterium]HIP71837.1 SDR family oxidoreductase [Anaerolineae bacterium]
MIDFTKQVVIITGATGNVGQAAAHAFRERGARLVLAGRSWQKLEATFPDLAAAGECLFVVADVTDAESVEALAGAAVGEYDRIDVLCNIAGGFQMGPPLHETSLKTWDFMLNLNAKSVFLTSRAVVPIMLEQGRGKIVNISSRAGLVGRPYMAPYSAAKSAVIRLTESLAAELKDQGINVNCLLPDTIDTPQNRQAMPNADFSKWVTPQAIADVILFLASSEANPIHGALLPVYGRV